MAGTRWGKYVMDSASTLEIWGLGYRYLRWYRATVSCNGGDKVAQCGSSQGDFGKTSQVAALAAGRKVHRQYSLGAMSSQLALHWSIPSLDQQGERSYARKYTKKCTRQVH